MKRTETIHMIMERSSSTFMTNVMKAIQREEDMGREVEVQYANNGITYSALILSRSGATS